jgi:hypothetical protein
MFRASPDSSQIDLFSNLEQFLRERDQEQLNDPNAWHNVILDQVVKRVSEERFVELFDEATGRPNAPLRVLMGMLILKEGFGWRDEALFEAVHFHLLVRRALGLLKLTDEVPVASTYYLFKPRWYAHPVETGVNRLQEVFPELTRDQAKRLGVVGEQRRMDSTLLGSNLAACTRLQLIIGCVQARWKSLSAEQQACLSEADSALLDRLSAKRPSQHLYRREEPTKQAWLEDCGQLLLRLHQTDDLKSSPRSALIARLWLAQYQINEADEAARVVLKPTQEISADSLQAPHDADTAYRKQRDATVRGYSVNLTETGQEALNLIVDVRVEPATAADNGYRKDAVQRSEQVLETTAQEISADGAYYRESNEAYAQEPGQDIHDTGFPGQPGRYDDERTANGVVVIDRGSGERQLAEEYQPGRYRCRADSKWRSITDKAVEAAACRRRTEALPRELFNRRCNVEASIFQLSYHTRKKKLKYRGGCAVQRWAVCRAAWINIKRMVIYPVKSAEILV